MSVAPRRVTIVADRAAVEHEAATLFTRQAERGVAARGLFRAVLSGGSTPRGLYRLLARRDAPHRARIPWPQVELYWGDERCVPPDHPDSNYRMAREELLDAVPVEASKIHRIRGEAASAGEAADEYEALLRSLPAPSPEEGPRFDLVLLGLGADGHTASLFPDGDALRETGRLVAATWVDRLAAHRVTMTPKAINASSAVVFLVAGAEKSGALAAVIDGEERPDRLPAQAIRPRRGELLFLADRAAASGLRDHA